MNLRSKILAGYAAVVALLLLVGGVNVGFLLKVNNTLKEIGEQRFQVEKQLRGGLDLIEAIQEDIWDALVFPDTDLAARTEAIDELAKRFYLTMDRLRLDISGGGESVEALVRDFQSFYVLAKRILLLKYGGGLHDDGQSMDLFQQQKQKLTATLNSLYTAQETAFDQAILKVQRQSLALVVVSVGCVVLGSLMALGLGLVASRRITRPIKALMAAVKGVGRGETGVAAPVESPDEIGRLAESFNEMARELRAREDRLRQSEQTMRSMFENATDGIFRVTFEGKPVLANPAQAAILGYASPEAFLEDVGDVSVLYDDPAVRGRLLELLSARGEVRHFETDFRRKDGSIRHGVISARLVMDESDGTRYVEGLFSDVTDRRKAMRLRMDKEAAEAANRAKSEFLANMSHEIRTPLNVIQGMADLLWETELTEQQRSYVETFRSSGINLLEVINRILDVSRIEHGALELEAGCVDLGEVMDKTRRFFAAQAAAKNLDFDCVLAPDAPRRVQGDATRLLQVLFNLVGNAVKFTHSGSVEVRATAAPEAGPNAVRFEVADTGIGIRPDKQKVVFESFTQADASTTREYGGTGLGLTISRALVERMGGKLELESAPGRGSVFTFTIAFAPCGDGESALALPAAPPRDAGPGLNILLAEDSENNRMLMTFYFQKTPHRLDIAVNGAQAVAMFERRRYDLVIMDIQMPVMDGYEAIRAIRKLEREQNLVASPVLALTAHALEEDRDKCLAAGCTEYLAKPIKKSVLLAAVDRYARPQGGTTSGPGPASG